VSDHHFVENSEGVHIFGPGMGGEFTLCGDAFDIADTDKHHEGFQPTRKRTVTCPKCIDVILHCRGVRIGPAPKTPIRTRRRSA